MRCRSEDRFHQGRRRSARCVSLSGREIPPAATLRLFAHPARILRAADILSIPALPDVPFSSHRDTLRHFRGQFLHLRIGRYLHHHRAFAIRSCTVIVLFAASSCLDRSRDISE